MKALFLIVIFLLLGCEDPNEDLYEYYTNNAPTIVITPEVDTGIHFSSDSIVYIISAGIVIDSLSKEASNIVWRLIMGQEDD